MWSHWWYDVPLLICWTAITGIVGAFIGSMTTAHVIFKDAVYHKLGQFKRSPTGRLEFEWTKRHE